MTAAIIMAGLVVIVAIIVFGVYMVARSTGDMADRIREQGQQINHLTEVIGTKQREINKRDVEISQLMIDLQTEKNRIHERDEK